MAKIQFGTDGWRAVIAEDFTFENVSRVAQATASYWNANPVADTVKRAVAEKKAILVDVREQEEWEQGHVVGAKLLPLSLLEKGVKAEDLARVIPKGTVVYCHCLAGGRCLEAAKILAPLGYDVRALKPGYPQLEKAGFPTAKGR